MLYSDLLKFTKNLKTQYAYSCESSFGSELIGFIKKSFEDQPGMRRKS